MKVLTKEQAQSLYAAMCSLNDVDLDAQFSFTVTSQHGPVTVKSTPDAWGVIVMLDDTILTTFDNQGEFVKYHGGSV
jgi:hypothetical protein